jgi:uncharacterized integral membrane protein
MAIFRYLKILFLVLVAIVLVLLLLSNQEPVSVSLLPASLAGTLGWDVTVSEVRVLPEALANTIGMDGTLTLTVALIVAASLIVGIVVGFIWEWLREHRFRAEAKTQRREAQRLNQEVAQMKGGSDTQDDVLAILDQADAAR